MSIQHGTTEPDFVQFPEEGNLYEPEAELDVPDDDKKLSRSEIVLASTIIGGNFFISVCFTVLAAFFPQSVSLIEFDFLLSLNADFPNTNLRMELLKYGSA